MPTPTTTLSGSTGYTIQDASTRRVLVGYVPFGWIDRHRADPASVQPTSPAALGHILNTPEPSRKP